MDELKKDDERDAMSAFVLRRARDECERMYSFCVIISISINLRCANSAL